MLQAKMNLFDTSSASLASTSVGNQPSDGILLSIADLKKRLITIYGGHIYQFESKVEPPPELLRSDTPEERSAKIVAIKRYQEERKKELLSHADEIYVELNKLIERVKDTNKKYNDSQYAKSNLALNTPAHIDFRCRKCGNKDINNTIVDEFRGDVTCNGADNKGCGEVLHDHIINAGAEKRNFEGEEVRSLPKEFLFPLLTHF